MLMKKKKLANIVMVVVIVAMVCSGVLAALHFRKQGGNELGSEFQTGSIPNDAILLSEEPENLCKITIVCDTILSNQEKLDPAKIAYVPADGVILRETVVEFNEGETVFDVLQRVCTACDIQLEYSWTPIYDSYYIEGINHLYEFDCGNQSGWMYKVNGEFPNYGCSSYEVQHGDEIVWCYTCEGLGTDVGAKME
ncbi:MAG: DUF4430 domain-containing protein [Oscillospiraceae bacterium]|nr:DUF4430 domain-containing protein [Oscillospiraceae bacterium]